jgi:hypothetical protein
MVVTSYFTRAIDQAAWDVQHPDDAPRRCDTQSCGYYMARATHHGLLQPNYVLVDTKHVFWSSSPNLYR